VTKNRRKAHGTKPSADKGRPRSVSLLWLGAILVLTFVVYIPCLDNGFTNWDDNHYVTTNPLLAHPSGQAVLTTPVQGNYHPLTIWSLALNYRISGLHPASYHWLNLLLHLANTALVFLFIRMLSGGRLWTTVVTSLFFGIHPMHVESVAWIAERKDVLYAFFYLLGLITYLKYLERRQLLWLGITLLAFVLSVASKAAAVVFPVTLWTIDYFRRRAFNLSAVVEKVPFLVVSLIAGMLTLKAQQSTGAVADLHLWNPVEKLLIASYGTLMYVVKLFVPVHLSALYPYPNVEGGLGPEFYLALVILAVLLPTVVYLCRRVRVVLFGLACFFVNIALALQFFAVGQAVMAECYTYLPYIGLFFALAWWLDKRPREIPSGFPVERVVAGCFLLLVPLSLFQTWTRCDVWKDSGTLWNDTIQKFPRAERAWNYKGVTLAEQNRYDSAYDCFDRAIELKPNYSEALNNRGAIKLRRSDAAGALADVSRAIALNIRYRDAYTNRSIAYDMLGEYEKSIPDSRRAIELDPMSPNNYLAYCSIGEALQKLARHPEAIPAYNEAIRSAPRGEPRLGSYYLFRSYSWLALGDRGRALSDAREAQRLGTQVDLAYLGKLGG